MTYWVDEDRDSAFCLIKAPCEKAVVDMHNQAHGLVPYEIIEVNPNIVEAFLGRIHDPGFLEELNNPKLKVFEDTAVRTILVFKTTNFNLLKFRLGKDAVSRLQNLFFQTLNRETEKHLGKLVELQQKYFAASFRVMENALAAAIQVIESLSQVMADIHLQISIGVGLPVTQNPLIFGETLQSATSKFLLKENKPLLLSSEVKLISLVRLKNENLYKRTNSSEEKIINRLFDILLNNWQNSDFNLKRFSNQMAMSKSSLYRNCKILTGKSPNSLLRHFRLLQSLDLFQEKTNIARISYDSGFNSPAYFSQCFQQKFGLKPGEYQNHL